MGIVNYDASQENKDLKPTIIINGEAYEGSFSFSLDVKTETIYGKISTEFYLDDIVSLESCRYTIKGIHIVSLYFGSDENTIIYDFESPMKELGIKY